MCNCPALTSHHHFGPHHSTQMCKCLGTDHVRTSSRLCPLNKNYVVLDETMLGWRGSGRGTSAERVREGLLKRGVDIAIIEARWGSLQESQSLGFYEESQQPQGEDDLTQPDGVNRTEDDDLTQPDGPKGDDVTLPYGPENDDDSTPVKTPVNDDDSTPVKEYAIGGHVVDSTPVHVQEHAIGDNVLARWSSKKWYLAHVTHYFNGRYSVYFMDGNEKINMSPSSVRVLECANPPPRRRDMLNKVFYDDGDGVHPPGRWKVRRIENNEYVCTRLTGGDGVTNNMDKFDIGHVIRSVQGAQQSARELGPCTELVVSEPRRRRCRRL